MKRTFFVLLIAGSAVAAAVGVLRGRDQDQHRIRKNLAQLAAWVSKTEKESELVTLSKNQRLIALFTRECRIKMGHPVPEIEGLEMLTASLQLGKQSVERVKVSLRDIAVTIAKDHSEAKTKMTILATVPDPERAGNATDARELEIKWKKIGGVWKIDEVKEVEVLH